MYKILKTTLLEFEKSGFLIDLVQNSNNKKYIQIEQTVIDSNEKHTIKINPTVLSDIIKVLSDYQLHLISTKNKTSNKTVSDEQQNEIVRPYLKGVPLKDLSLQFGMKVQQIEQILFNRNMEIIDGEQELKKVGQRFWHRRKRK